MKPLPADHAACEADVIAGAVNWTIFVQLGPHDRRRADFATKDAAVEQARVDAPLLKRDVLVYASNEAGRAVMAGKVTPDSVFVPVSA